MLMTGPFQVENGVKSTGTPEAFESTSALEPTELECMDLEVQQDTGSCYDTASCYDAASCYDTASL